MSEHLLPNNDDVVDSTPPMESLTPLPCGGELHDEAEEAAAAIAQRGPSEEVLNDDEDDGDDTIVIPVDAEAEDFDVITDDDDFDVIEDDDSDPTPARRSREVAVPDAAKFAPQRLAKILAAAGIDARRKCEEYVTTGRVTVDGEVITDLAFRADPFSQRIELDGERLKVHRKVYFVLNKPRGVVCTNFDPAGRPRVIDLFPQFKERLFTIGRLDEESEGLLLVTNDGELANRMAHPRYRVPKFYMCHVKGVPSTETLATLKRGMYFEEGKFAVEGVRMKKVVGDSSYLDIVLNEGQNREIRRLLARVDHRVMRLKRVGFGPIRLGDLPAGAFRQLTTPEIQLLNDLSQQRAYLDNTAGRGRKKKFGTKPPFGNNDRRPFNRQPAYSEGADDTPRPRRTFRDDQNFEEAPGQRPVRGPRRFPARGFSNETSQGDMNRRPRPPYRDGQNSEDGQSRRPVRGPRRFPVRGMSDEASQSNQSRPPRRPYRDDQQQNSEDQSQQRRGSRPRGYGQGNGPRGGYGQGNRSRGYGQANDRPRGYGQSDERPRRPRRTYSDQTPAASANMENAEFGGGRRRFVTEDTPESSFNRRPPRSSERPPRRPPYRSNVPQGEGDAGDQTSQRRPARGPRRPGQNRFGQAGNRELPARGQRPVRPLRPMTDDGREILEGKVTGYRSIPKEGVPRRRREAIQGMQINRKQRQQRRKKTDDA